MKSIILSISLMLMSGYMYSQERKVAFYEQEGIQVINAEFAQRAKLYTEYPNFKEAKIYAIPDSTFAIEIFYSENSQELKNRTVYTKPELKLYLDSIQSIIATNFHNYEIDQSGRTPLLVTSSILGLSYYGVLSTIYIGRNSNSDKADIAAYMLGAGASFALPYYLTRDKSVTKAQTSMIVHGQTRGALAGLALANSFKATQNDIDVKLLSSMGVSIGSGVLNNYIAKNNNYNIGQASTYQMSVDAGIINGTIVGLLFQKDIDESISYGFGPDPNEDARLRNKRVLFGSILTSSIIHGYAGKRIADMNKYTLGDAIFMRNSAVLGATLPIPFLAMSKTENDKAAFSIIMAGEVAGSLYGAYALKGKDYSTSDAALLTLTHLSGGLIGTGIGVLLVPDNKNSNEAAIITSGTALGSLAGFYFMKKFIDTRYTQVKKEEMSLNFNINPMGLYGKRLGFNSEQLGSMPIVNMHFTF